MHAVVVTDVEFGSPASDKGFVPNMVITAINDRSIESASDWRRALDRIEPGSSVTIDVVIRDQTTFCFLRLPSE